MLEQALILDEEQDVSRQFGGDVRGWSSFHHANWSNNGVENELTSRQQIFREDAAAAIQPRPTRFPIDPGCYRTSGLFAFAACLLMNQP